MLPALLLVLIGTACRLLSAAHPVLANFSPLMAMAFCGAVYFRRGGLWFVPFVALSLSDVWLNHHYAAEGYGWTLGAALVRTGCFAAALGLGALVARHRTWANLFSGALGGALLFYLVTNTGAWWDDVFYAKTAAGWWQAMTVGHPEWAPTLYFFRNTLVSDLLFTGLFALAMETTAQRRGEPSLLARRVADASSLSQDSTGA